MSEDKSKKSKKKQEKASTILGHTTIFAPTTIAGIPSLKDIKDAIKKAVGANS